MASFGTGEDIANQGVLAFKLVDVIGKQAGDTMRRALSPARLHIVNLVAQDISRLRKSKAASSLFQ